MRTKFILSGGYAGRPNEINDKYFSEILKTDKKKMHILLVYFAKPEEHKRMFKEDTAQFERNNRGHEQSFEIAEEGKLAEQVKKADVVYLHGGPTLKLLSALKKCPNLKELFKGRIIAGESAGAYVLSTCFYSKTEGGIFHGLGFVPVKTICHYIGVNHEKLKKCGEDLEELLLPDYEHKVFYIDV